MLVGNGTRGDGKSSQWEVQTRSTRARKMESAPGIHPITQNVTAARAGGYAKRVRSRIDLAAARRGRAGVEGPRVR